MTTATTPHKAPIAGLVGIPAFLAATASRSGRQRHENVGPLPMAQAVGSKVQARASQRSITQRDCRGGERKSTTDHLRRVGAVGSRLRPRLFVSEHGYQSVRSALSRIPAVPNPVLIPANGTM